MEDALFTDVEVQINHTDSKKTHSSTAKYIYIFQEQPYKR
jgi:hypothetical protein